MRHLILLCLATVLAAGESAAPPATPPVLPSLTLDLTIKKGTGDNPLLVAWAEKADGTFVRTLQIFGKAKGHYADLTAWSTARAKAKEKLDGVVGATVKWGKGQTVVIPLGDLLDGTQVLRIEQRGDGGGHYKSFKLPLPADFNGGTITDNGYIEKLVITVNRPATPAPPPATPAEAPKPAPVVPAETPKP